MTERYVIDGMKSMLRDGCVNLGMSFEEVQQNCEEPDLHEFDDLEVMLQNWEQAKTEFRRELMPLRVRAAAIRRLKEGAATPQPVPSLAKLFDDMAAKQGLINDQFEEFMSDVEDGKP